MPDTTPLIKPVQAMPPEIPRNKEYFAEGSGFVAIAIIISAINYIYRVATGETKWGWLTLAAQAGVGGVAGYLTWTLCLHWNLATEQVSFCTGVAGWAGPRVMETLEAILMRFLKASKIEK